jgi:ribonuclease HII
LESYEFQPRIIPPRQHVPNPLSANIIDVEDENETGANNDLDNGDEVQELSPAIANANKKAYVILDKPNKKPKTSTTLVIQEHISKISESASSFVSSRQAGITIEQVMGHVVACGAGYGSDEHFVAMTELFVKKDHRKIFMTIPTMEARLSLLKRKYDLMFRK